MSWRLKKTYHKKARNLIMVLFVVIMFFSFFSFADAAGTPSIFSYQGRLTDSSGNLLGSSSGTTYYFKFSIWNMATGGTQGTNQLWPVTAPSSVALTVRQGVFNANIGDTATGFPHALDYDFNTSSDVYLQVEVSSDNATFQTLSPRQRISSAPFARLAGAVVGSSTPSTFGTVTPFGTSVVSVQATSTQTTPLSLRGILSQIANLFQIQDSTGANVFSINNLGGIFASSTLLVGSSTGNTSFSVGANGNVGVGTAAPSRKFNVYDVNSDAQLRLSQSGSNSGDFRVDSAGDIQVSSSGGNIRQNDENLWVCSGGACGATAPGDRGNIIVETGVIFNNNFKLKQINASTTVMYDTTNNPIFEFDEGQ